MQGEKERHVVYIRYKDNMEDMGDMIVYVDS